MKRAASTIVATGSKKTKLSSTDIESLPKELLVEVLARVGAFSVIDLFNAKLSCKTFYEAAEDIHVYRHVSLDNFPLIEWKSPSEKQQAFLRRCTQCQNAEILYRRGVVDFFGGKRIEFGLMCLQKAINLKYDAAKYAVICIILFFSRNDELKEKSIKILARMKNSRSKRQEVKVYRDKLVSMLRSIWVKVPLTQCRPIYCSGADKHKRSMSWPNEEEEEEDDVCCEGCSANTEVNFLSNIRLVQQRPFSDNFLPQIIDQLIEEFS